MTSASLDGYADVDPANHWSPNQLTRLDCSMPRPDPDSCDVFPEEFAQVIPAGEGDSQPRSRLSCMLPQSDVPLIKGVRHGAAWGMRRASAVLPGCLKRRPIGIARCPNAPSFLCRFVDYMLTNGFPKDRCQHTLPVYRRSQRADSNRRPAVYETAALPTELRWPTPGQRPRPLRPHLRPSNTHPDDASTTRRLRARAQGTPFALNRPRYTCRGWLDFRLRVAICCASGHNRNRRAG